VHDPPDTEIESRQSGPSLINTSTIGEAWIAVCQRIVELGADGLYDGLPIREIIMVTLTIADPRGNDPSIERLAGSNRLAWMRTNFANTQPVEALGDADSYATRLRDYEHSGRDQVQWVIDRLQADPLTRSATITTLQPLSDTTYVPCVSLLDFFLVDERLELIVYAHSIDFGTKGFANLAELARLQEEVAEALGSGVGTLTMVVKSAHVYTTEIGYVESVLSQSNPD
jgi:thymidylate synthase